MMQAFNRFVTMSQPEGSLSDAAMLHPWVPEYAVLPAMLFVGTSFGVVFIGASVYNYFWPIKGNGAIDYTQLSCNPEADRILERSSDRIDWSTVSRKNWLKRTDMTIDASS